MEAESAAAQEAALEAHAAACEALPEAAPALIDPELPVAPETIGDESSFVHHLPLQQLADDS